MASSNFYISIILATNSIDRLKNFLDHLEALTANPQYLEVLLNVDHDATALHAFILQESRKRPFLIKYHQRDNSGGYFDLNLGYDDLLNYLDHNSYFVMLLSDAFRFTTIDWDLIVRQYYRLFPDDLFYLRISNNKYVYHRNYSEVWDRCENWGIYTKKWLSVVKGWGAFWCPDAWQEMIHYHFMKKAGKIRAIPVPSIHYKKLESSFSETEEGMIRWLLGELFLARIMLSRQGLRVFSDISQTILISLKNTSIETDFFVKKNSMFKTFFLYYHVIFTQLNLALKRPKPTVIRLYFLCVPTRKVKYLVLSFFCFKLKIIHPYTVSVVFNKKVDNFLSSHRAFKKMKNESLKKYLIKL